MNKYENYTNKELFKLWKDINSDIKYNEQNGIFDSSKYDLYLVGEELVKRGFMLDEEEYNAIDYYLKESKLYDSGFWVCQEDWGEDYFHDDENEENLTLEEGLQVIYESITDNIKEYPIEILNGLKKAIKRFLGKEI